MHGAKAVPGNFSTNDTLDVAPEYIASLTLAERDEGCISRESSPGHIDGNDVFYH